MSRESLDITDQIKYEHELFGLPLSGSSLRRNNARYEDQQDHQLPLGVKLTGYRLLNVAIILTFGIVKAILSYRGGSAIPTTLDLVSGSLLAVVLYYVGLLQDKRPEICPLFFQVDWAPSILRFIRRSEVHHFFFLLSPVQPAVVLLQYAMKVRGERGFIIGYRYFEPSASSSIIVRNAVTVATAWIILGTVAALQHFTKVVYRLRALYSVLAQDIVWMGLLVVWAASQPYITSHVTVKFVPVDRNGPGEDYERLGKRTDISSIVTMGHVMTIAPIILLLESVEFKNVSRILQLMERRATLQRIIQRLPIVLPFTKRILLALYLVALLITLGKNREQPFNVLHLCIMFIFFSRIFLISLSTSWRSTIANVQKTLFSEVLRVGSGARDYYSSRAVGPA